MKEDKAPTEFKNLQ